jgi:predicted ATPase
MGDLPKICISCVRTDFQAISDLYHKLKKSGFAVSLIYYDGSRQHLHGFNDPGMPGESIAAIDQRSLTKIEELKSNCDCFFITLSSESSIDQKLSQYINQECEFALQLQQQRREPHGLRVFSIIVSHQHPIIQTKDPNYPERIKDIRPLVWSDANSKQKEFEQLMQVLRNPKVITERPRSAGEITKAQRGKDLFIRKIVIKNIKCFTELTLDIRQGEIDKWVMILGDNAIGKSTLLKSITLGLCQESDAVALTKTPGEGNEFIRDGAEQGSIMIELQRGKLNKNTRNKYMITTTITRDTGGTAEIIRKETTQPLKETTPFPWHDIFVCAYGTYRAQRANDSHKRYSFLDAVRPLFDRQALLQNPELILLRQPEAIRDLLQTKLLQILMLDQENDNITLNPTGLDITGPWGTTGFTQLSDGYRSTTLWVLDFLSWLIYAQKLDPKADVGGILIIDELEQHLHPRWQQRIVECLRRQFPQTQIISSTHTPLVAAGIADIEESCLLKLERGFDQAIHVVSIPRETVEGQRADQILTSPAFDLVTTRNEHSHDEVDLYTHLLSKSQLTAAEEAKVQALRTKLQQRFTDGETSTARAVRQAVDGALDQLVTEIDPTSLDLETRKQLQELFSSES